MTVSQTSEPPIASYRSSKSDFSLLEGAARPGRSEILKSKNMLNKARFFLLGWLGLLSSSALAQTYVNRVGPQGAIQDITVTQSATWNSAGSP
jgi:hypothetical protein